MDKQLSDIYYDPETGFGGPDKLYKTAKEKGLNVTRKFVTDWIAKQESAQILKQKPLKKKDFTTIRSERKRQFYQLDIMVYNRFKWKSYQYVICMIDIFSRYATARAMTNKRMETLIEAVKSMYEEMGACEVLEADNEFNKKEFITFAEDEGSKLFFFQPNEERKNAIVERFHYSLSTLIMKYRTASGDHDWPKALPKLLKNYNNRVHSTTKAKPIDIWNGKKTNKQTYNKPQVNIAVGDRVRIPEKSTIFSKGDRPLFSKEIYTVSEIVGNKLVLKDEKGKEMKLRIAKNEVQKITDVEVREKPEQEEKEHKETQKQLKQGRKLKEAGVEEKNVKEGKRTRNAKVWIDPETGEVYPLN